MTYQKIIGNQGEARVARYLRQHHYYIRAQQWHCRYGEIDIVAYDRPARELVFVEVKTRSIRWVGHFPALHTLQMQRLAASIECYLAQVPWYDRYRFDLIIVRPQGILTHYRQMPLE